MALDINDSNNMAKIEIRAKPIDAQESTYHLFIIYTIYNQNGDKIEYIFRGGPGIGDGSIGGSSGGLPEVIGGGSLVSNPMEYFGAPYGDITTEQGVYGPYAMDPNTGLPIINPSTGVPFTGVDWFPDAMSTTIKVGTQSELSPYFSSISDQMIAIQLAHYRYNPVSQNSNTTVWQALINSGLIPRLPTYNDGTPIWAPGHSQNFKTPLQELQEYLSTASNEVKEWVNINYNDLLAQANEILGIFKPIPAIFNNGMDSMYQSYLKFIDGLSESIEEGGYIGNFQEYVSSTIENTTNKISDAISTAYQDFLDAVARSLLVDPLVIDMAGDGLSLDSWQKSNALFDLDANGTKENTGWTKANDDDAFLVIDKNNNGNVDNIMEMFGNAAMAGFVDLKSYDSNNDNLINSSDSQFGLMKLWNDKNANGIVDTGELTTLAANGITQISLNKYSDREIIEGNLQTAISEVTFANGTIRNIHELSFGFDGDTITTSGDRTLNGFKIKLEALLLPYSRGYSNLFSWQVAANDNFIKFMAAI